MNSTTVLQERERRWRLVLGEAPAESGEAQAGAAGQAGRAKLARECPAKVKGKEVCPTKTNNSTTRCKRFTETVRRWRGRFRAGHCTLTRGRAPLLS